MKRDYARTQLESASLDTQKNIIIFQKGIDFSLGKVYNTFRSQRKTAMYGSIAQLGEHLPYKQRVIGSSPIVPTKILHECVGFFCFTGSAEHYSRIV